MRSVPDLTVLSHNRDEHYAGHLTFIL